MEKEVEERVGTLEATLGQFMVQTGKAINRLSQEIVDFKEEGERDRKEMRETMTRFEEKAEQNWLKSDERMTRFEEKAERDWLKSDERMTRFEQQAEHDREEMRETMTRFEEKAERDWLKSDERMTRFEEKAERDWLKSDERMMRFEQQAEHDREEMQKTRDYLSREMLDYREEGERSRKEMNKQWGNLANKMGTLAEDIAAPNARTIAHQHFGCTEIDTYGVRILRRNRNDRRIVQEFDVVLSCGNYLFINETKSTVQTTYIDEFKAKLDHIFDYFPEHEGKQVIPVFSSLSLPDKHIDYLTDSKILAMAMGEGTMVVYNLEKLLADWQR